MAKLTFSVLMIVVWWMLHALQMDEELAMGTVHEAKRAVNRAAHAAAQQVDGEKLELGVIAIDPETAETAAAAYLRENLLLDAELNPVPGSFLKDPVEVLVFEVLSEHLTYPYTYRNTQYAFEVTFERPGIVLIARVKYPRMFGVMAPVQWELKGSAELVY